MESIATVVATSYVFLPDICSCSTTQIGTYSETLFTSSESIMRNNPLNYSANHREDDSSPRRNKSTALTVKSFPIHTSPPTPAPPIPTYRTFADFDSGFNFPAQVAAVPYSPNISEAPPPLDRHPELPSKEREYFSPV